MSRALPPALPRQQDGALCPGCLAMPRQEHTLPWAAVAAVALLIWSLA